MHEGNGRDRRQILETSYLALRELMIPSVGNGVPRRRYPLLRPLGLWILRIMGWTGEGEVPDCPRAVVALAPHSTNWDFIVGAAMLVALELRISYIAKHTLFVGPLGWFVRWLGGIPVDRSRPERFAEFMVRVFEGTQARWLVVTPEGTRKPVPRFKTGFYRIAQEAGVPIVPVYFNHERRVIGFLPPVQPISDIDQGVAELRELLLRHGARKT